MKININTPCNVPWQSMQDHAQGKFCLQCSKQVIDFTRMSDAELIKVLQSAGSGVCGRFKKTQLERPLFLNTAPKQPHLFRKILAGLLLLAGAEHELAAQTGEPEIQAQSELTLKGETTMVPQDGSLLMQVKGRVVDKHSKEPIPFCMIYIKGSHTSTATNNDGYFVLDIPKSVGTNSIVLQFNYIGYETYTKTIQPADAARDITVFLKEDEDPVLMGDIMYVEDPPKKKEKRKEK